ncbi:hypothetical protein [Pseudobutyrivibrio xylanivorans]|uniref:hypothetical protein n=1 Tax=Pseudobutyrivibrio xylanivorans TaxID=185007 RepID=UPI00142EDB32|nr:hypothetical protein [Pseudobutyrivibrio xylanivorans]
MYREIAYTINPEKKEDFLKKFYSSSLKTEEWEKIKNESRIIDKSRLDDLFRENR